MELFSSGTGNYNGRRTRIVVTRKLPEGDDCPKVLVTRTLTVKQLVSVSNYEPSTVQAAREYEVDLPAAEQLEAILAAAETAKDNQMEISVTVVEADPDFEFDK